MNSTHKVTRTPVGPMLVYMNGLLQLAPIDYTIDSAPMPTITPLNPAVGDLMSTVFTRAVPLSFTLPSNQAVTYWGYVIWREDWIVTA